MIDTRPVVHFIHFSSKPGGIEVLLPVISEAMTGYRFMSYVINKPEGGDRNIYNSLNIPVMYGNGINIWTLIKILKYARKYRNDVFHTFNIGPLILLLLKSAGVRRIVHSIHGTVYWKTKKQKAISRFLWSLACRQNIVFTSNSEHSRSVFWERVHQGTDIQVLYNPVDSRKFAPSSPDYFQAGLRVVYAGRLCRGKNLDRWIETAVEIHRIRPETQFELYGAGPLLEDLQGKVASMGAGSFIHFNGFRDDIAEVYRRSDVLLFLSEYESFGNVAVEAILCGTPVIASDIPAMREIFRDFPEFIIDSGRDLSSAVSGKLAELPQLKDLVYKARKQFLERFSVEAHCMALSKIYREFND